MTTSVLSFPKDEVPFQPVQKSNMLHLADVTLIGKDVRVRSVKSLRCAPQLPPSGLALLTSQSAVRQDGAPVPTDGWQ